MNLAENFPIQLGAISRDTGKRSGYAVVRLIRSSDFAMKPQEMSGVVQSRNRFEKKIDCILYSREHTQSGHPTGARFILCASGLGCDYRILCRFIPAQPLTGKRSEPRICLYTGNLRCAGNFWPICRWLCSFSADTKDCVRSDICHCRNPVILSQII